MPKTTRRRSPAARRARAHAAARPEIDVITQLQTAARYPQAALLGAAVGGVVPWFARELAHGELQAAWASSHALGALVAAIVLGCCAFSMISVFKFGLSAFGDRRKAVGFVVALEGVMVVSHGAVGLVALLALVLINAVSNGCHIATAKAARDRRVADDARRSATRASNRAAAAAARTGASTGVSTPTAAPATAAPTAVSAEWYPVTAARSPVAGRAVVVHRAPIRVYS